MSETLEARPAGTSPVDTISAADAAKLLMLESTRRVQQLAAEGYFQKAGRDRYFTVSVIQGYIRFLKEDKREKSLANAQVATHKARARDYEIRNARADHTLIDLIEAEGVIDEIASQVKLGMDGVAASVTRDLPLRNKIQDAVDAVFAGISSRIIETLAALRASGEALAPDAEDDA